MSRQIQIRRGTTTQHSGFTGVIGEITMDTTTKTIRVHDGETAGGIELARADAVQTYTMPSNYDFVIESATGMTGTNYTNGWYRKYKSGWIEQGGDTAFTAYLQTKVVALPVTMSNTTYRIQATDTGSNPRTGEISTGRTSTSTITVCNGRDASYFIASINWEVKGYIATT